MRATEFEFRIRFIIIMAVFIAGFWCYAWDPVCVAAALAQPFMGHTFNPDVSSDRRAVQAVFGIGATLTVLAALVRTWAAAYLRSEVVHDMQIHGEALVADGPYRYVRNPLYFGSVLFAVGFAMSASRLGFVVIVGGLSLFFYRLIAREESLLSATQGESYRRFVGCVPRLLPSLRPRLPAGGLIPRWGQAVVGEAFMWFFAFAAVCFAATLNRRVFLIMTSAGIAASALAKAAMRRAAPPKAINP